MIYNIITFILNPAIASPHQKGGRLSGEGGILLDVRGCNVQSNSDIPRNRTDDMNVTHMKRKKKLKK